MAEVIETLTPLVDEASATITYIGKATVGTLTSDAAWRISRLDEGTIALDTTWADGNKNFDNVWDDRASLTYSHG